MTQVKQGASLLKELQDKIGKQLDERESAIKNYSPSPVSYTHLTLPTILLV